MRKLFCFLSFLFILFATSCSMNNSVNISGDIISNTIELNKTINKFETNNFNFSNDCIINLIESNEKYLVTYKYKSDLDSYDFNINVENNTLTCSTNSNTQYLNSGLEINIYGNFNELNIKGSYNLNFDANNIKMTTFTIKGAIDLTAKNFSVEGAYIFDIDGAISANFYGEADVVKLTCNGACNIDAKELVANSCDINAHGAADFKISVIKKLTGVVHGAANVEYYGNITPNIEYHGLGTVKRLSRDLYKDIEK